MQYKHFCVGVREMLCKVLGEISAKVAVVSIVGHSVSGLVGHGISGDVRQGAGQATISGAVSDSAVGKATSWSCSWGHCG